MGRCVYLVRVRDKGSVDWHYETSHTSRLSTYPFTSISPTWVFPVHLLRCNLAQAVALPHKAGFRVFCSVICVQPGLFQTQIRVAIKGSFFLAYYFISLKDLHFMHMDIGYFSNCDVINNHIINILRTTFMCRVRNLMFIKVGK